MVSSESYVEMLSEEFIPFLRKCGELNHAYFMQDGASPHTANKTLNFLHDNFEDRVISGKYKEQFQCGFSWPPYSPDLNPCDFFLRGFLRDSNSIQIKSAVQSRKSETIRQETSRNQIHRIDSMLQPK